MCVCVGWCVCGWVWVRARDSLAIFVTLLPRSVRLIASNFSTLLEPRLSYPSQENQLGSPEFVATLQLLRVDPTKMRGPPRTVNIRFWQLKQGFFTARFAACELNFQTDFQFLQNLLTSGKIQSVLTLCRSPPWTARGKARARVGDS